MTTNSENVKKRVLCCGTFDYFHPGHESFLRQAAGLGNELFVVIARDSNVKNIKGKYPDHDELTRKLTVESLGIADEVRLGYEGSNFLRIVKEVNPDIIALGYDQHGPTNLEKMFPNINVKIMKAFRPEKFKSSFLRRNKNNG